MLFVSVAWRAWHLCVPRTFIWPEHCIAISCRPWTLWTWSNWRNENPGQILSQLAALSLFRLFQWFGIDDAFSPARTIFSWDVKFLAYYFSFSRLLLLASRTLLVVLLCCCCCSHLIKLNGLRSSFVSRDWANQNAPFQLHFTQHSFLSLTSNFQFIP